MKSIIQLKFNVEVLKSLPASKFTVTFKQALLFDNLLKFFFLLPEVPKVLLLLLLPLLNKSHSFVRVSLSSTAVFSAYSSASSTRVRDTVLGGFELGAADLATVF